MLFRAKALEEKLGKEALDELERFLFSREEEYKRIVQTYVEEKFERRLAQEFGLVAS